MLDKNHEPILDNDLTYVRNEFSNKSPNIILCSEPFLKTAFVNKLINSYELPVVFLDFDLLYSGYVVSEMIKKNSNVEIYRPNKTDWNQIVLEIAKKISTEKTLVIIDSLNGFYGIFDEKESGRFINASSMLLSSIGRDSNSSVIITAIVRKNDSNEWILSPGGRHIIDSKKSGTFSLRKIGNNMIFSSLNQIESVEKTFKMNCSVFE